MKLAVKIIMIPALPTSVPAFIGCTSAGNTDMYLHKISSLADYIGYFGDSGVLYRHMQLYFDNGGSECFVMSSGTCSPQLNAFISGLQLLDQSEEVTLLAIPESASLPYEEYTVLVREMLRHCASMRNRFAILDVYGGTEYTNELVTAHRTAVGEEHLRYGASYFPFLITSGDEQMLPPSAAIAGIICRADAEKGNWKAPANLSVSGVLKPAVLIDRNQQEGLNMDPVSGKSINVIRTFTGRGTLVWGARTLDGNSADWRYIPVQRFCSWVQSSVQKGLEPFAFEPNETATWLKVKTMVEEFLNPLWRRGALAGEKAEQGFFVKAGLGETMTAHDLAEGKLIVEVGLAMIRPAEFVVLRIMTAIS